MRYFTVYEKAIYDLDRCIEMINDGNDQSAAEKVENTYYDIEGSPVSQDTNLRAYVESIISEIGSGRTEEAKKYLIELRTVISRYQKDQISSIRMA